MEWKVVQKKVGCFGWLESEDDLIVRQGKDC
jgi:hypothetical protein